MLQAQRRDTRHPALTGPAPRGWAFGARTSNDSGLRESWGKCKVGPRVC